MGRSVSPEQWQLYAALRAAGWKRTPAAKEAGISAYTASSYDRGDRKSSGAQIKEILDSRWNTRPVPLGELAPEPARALEDFAYFRRRYFGRISTPWQEEAAYRVLGFLESPTKEFVVINCPPGSGKSTLFTHDIPAWLTCRRRHIRGLIISATADLAKAYTMRLRTTFESALPVQADIDDLENGLAVDAEATLTAEFGGFRPDNGSGGAWSIERFSVLQHEGRRSGEKEATWQAYGLDSDFIGNRISIGIADDSVSDKSLLTLEQIEKDRKRWDRVAERRLEPRGTLILQGQRLGPEDLYRYNLDKKVGENSKFGHHEDCCVADEGRKYHHIRYRAHDEVACVENHDEDAPYQGQAGGCLLDPRRLTFEELESEQTNDLTGYMTVFQQEDADPKQLLIDWMWIKGGRDPVSRIEYPGCYDRDRGPFEIPAGLRRPFFSIVTADPSPTRFWAIQWWVYVPASQERLLIACEKKIMGANDFLDRQWPSGDFIGLLEQWRRIGHDIGAPLTHLIFERNAAQRWAYRYQFFQDWLRLHALTLIPHDTQRNKTDEKMGISSLRHVYRHGRTRLPYKAEGQLHALRLAEEVTKYPQGRYDDQVMAQWFLEFNLPGVSIVEDTELTQERPSWLLAEVGA